MSENESKRICPHCREELPSGLDRRTKYCCKQCKKEADKLRDRLRSETPGRKKYVLDYRENNRAEINAKSKESMRERREENRDKANKAMREWKRRNKAKVKEQRRKYAEKNGRPFGTRSTELMLEKKMDRLAELNAKQAWRYWLKVKAPKGWLARYYKSVGKPWLNRYFSAAVKFRIRYRLDEGYRQRQIHKASKSRYKIKQRDDKTQNYNLLLKERKTCPYCGSRLTKDNLVIDHMDPVAKNGAHSQTNLVACCIPCNQKKRDKPFLDWVNSLRGRYRDRALSVYARKHGRPAEQAGLDFMFEE